MIKLRKLKSEDLELMFEWMQDEDIVKYLSKDFKKMTKEDCSVFIQNSMVDLYNKHYAIVEDDKDVYMGTVSLKNISNRSAEFAITVRREAMGKGIAIDAMRQILLKGFSELELEYVYWCVSPENKRAIRFYEKNGYHRVMPNQLMNLREYNKEQLSKYYWYREEI